MFRLNLKELSARDRGSIALLDVVVGLFSVGILTAAVFSNLKTVSSPLGLANSSFNYLMAVQVSLSGVGTITVGAGVSFVIV